MKATTLFVAEHSKTGKRYLGKTTNPKRLGKQYFGSGLHWKEHFRTHGKEHLRIVSRSEEFTNEEELTEFALFLSDELNVVESEQYLNMKEENGLDGGGEGSPLASALWSTATHKCEHCGDMFPPQVYGKFHGDYCESNPEKKEKRKIKCQACGEEKLPHIYYRDHHGDKCGRKREIRSDARPATSCLKCGSVVKGLMNLNQHQRGKVCKRRRRTHDERKEG